MPIGDHYGARLQATIPGVWTWWRWDRKLLSLEDLKDLEKRTDRHKKGEIGWMDARMRGQYTPTISKTCKDDPDRRNHALGLNTLLVRR